MPTAIHSPPSMISKNFVDVQAEDIASRTGRTRLVLPEDDVPDTAHERM